MSLSMQLSTTELEKLKGKMIVVKFGGSIFANLDNLHQLLQCIINLKNWGINPIVVHGGGADISLICKQFNIQPEFRDGQRVTDSKTLEVTQMVLAKINIQLVAALNSFGSKAIGLSGADVNLLFSEVDTNKNLGFVGRVKTVNTLLLQSLINLDLIPVIAPIGVGLNKQIYNINGDLAAGMIAGKMQADKFILVSDVDGCYQDISNPNSLYTKLTMLQIAHMIKNQEISGGMLPKLTCCIEALTHGAQIAQIINGHNPQNLLKAALDIDFPSSQITKG